MTSLLGFFGHAYLASSEAAKAEPPRIADKTGKEVINVAASVCR